MKSNNWPLVFLLLIAALFVLYAFFGEKADKSGNALTFIEKINSSPLSLDSPFAQFKREKDTKVPILMYHYVEYNKDKRDYLRDSLNIPPHIFEGQIITLKQNGYTFITPAQLNDGNISNLQKPIILSFDDGYADFYTDVYPILKKHNVKAVSYVVVNFVGRQNYMTRDQIAEINKSELVEFGSHTMNHSWLPGGTMENVEYELVQSKKSLEEILGIKVVSFAYPYGAHDSTVLSLVQKAGYNNAVSTDTGVSFVKNEAFALKRLRPGYNLEEDLLFIVQK